MSSVNCQSEFNTTQLRNCTYRGSPVQVQVLLGLYGFLPTFRGHASPVQPPPRASRWGCRRWGCPRLGERRARVMHPSGRRRCREGPCVGVARARGGRRRRGATDRWLAPPSFLPTCALRCAASSPLALGGAGKFPVCSQLAGTLANTSAIIAEVFAKVPASFARIVRRTWRCRAPLSLASPSPSPSLRATSPTRPQLLGHQTARRAPRWPFD